MRAAGARRLVAHRVWGRAECVVVRRPRARRSGSLTLVNATRLYAFGGFDGDRDLNDLWALELLPAAASAAAPRPTAHATHCLRRGAPFNVDVFKARQQRAAHVLHATPSFENKDGTSIHMLVSQAWRLRRDAR